MGNTSFNPADASAAISLSNGNLTATATNSNNNAVRTLGGPQYSGKYYFEISADAIANNYAAFGIAGPGAILSTLWNTNAALAAIRFRAGSIYYNGVSGPFTGQMIGSGNVCGVAVDLDNGKIWFRHPDGNGWNGDGSVGEDPATNSGGGDISGFCRLGVWPCALFAATGNILIANFGDSAFAHSVPSGFAAGWPTNDDALHIDPAAVASALVYSTASGAVTISTCGHDRDVLLFVFSEKTNGAPTVNSVSDTAGLTWQRRQQYQFDASNKGDIEVWWAHAPSQLTGDVVTVTLSASTHNSVIAAVGIANAASGLFDSNAGLPAAGSGSTSPGAITIDIDAGSENIAFGFWASATSTLPGPGGSFTKLRGQTNSGGVGYGSILLEGAHFGVGQDALTLDTAATGAVVWGMIADAVAAPDANPPIALSADLVEDAGFEPAITILIPPLELAAAFADDATLAPIIGLWPPLHLAAAFGDDAAFAAAITVLSAPLHLAADLADGAALAVYLTVGAAALRLAADLADEAVVAARATLFAAVVLSVAFTDDAELAAPVTIGFQPHAPPIQVVVVLSW